MSYGSAKGRIAEADFTCRYILRKTPMRNLIIASLLAAAAIPGAAFAQPYDPGCVRSNQQNQATGTILGAIGGALIGNAVAGRHDRGAGAVVGGVGGAIAGSAIAGSNNHPCPAGYAYAPPPPPPGYGPGPGPGPGDFWAGAPRGIHQRIDFMQDRIGRATQGGWLSPREVERINGELNRIRSEDQRLRYQDGGHLRPQDRDYLQGLLDNLSQRLHWMEHNH
jgi:hypothetical protein